MYPLNNWGTVEGELIPATTCGPSTATRHTTGCSAFRPTLGFTPIYSEWLTGAPEMLGETGDMQLVLHRFLRQSAPTA